MDLSVLPQQAVFALRVKFGIDSAPPDLNRQHMDSWIRLSLGLMGSTKLDNLLLTLLRNPECFKAKGF